MAPSAGQRFTQVMDSILWVRCASGTVFTLKVKSTAATCSSCFFLYWFFLLFGCFPYLSQRHSFSTSHHISDFGFHCTLWCTLFYPRCCLVGVKHLRRSIHMHVGPQQKRSLPQCIFWCTQLGCYRLWVSRRRLATNVQTSLWCTALARRSSTFFLFLSSPPPVAGHCRGQNYPWKCGWQEFFIGPRCIRCHCLCHVESWKSEGF